MAKIILDKNNIVEMPTLVLQNRNFDTIGSITDAHEFSYKENFNSANEIPQFIIYKYKNGKIHPLWDKLVDNKILYIPEFKERFEISVSASESNLTQKTATCTSLCESELSNIKLYDIEINTETDILNPDYDEKFPTIFYRDPLDYPGKTEKEVKRASLLHRLLEKAPHYSIRYVQESLKKLEKVATFSISDTDIYSEFTGEIAQEFGCIFIFDSLKREISVYDLYNTCANDECKYRGDFSDKCPECGSTEFSGQYGDDTTIFISNENLSTEISLTTNKDSMKNCFFVEGGDDVMTSAIRAINPNGSQYIFMITEEMKNDMPSELVSVLNEYDKLYNKYNETNEYILTRSCVDNYNSVVNYVNERFPLIVDGTKKDRYSNVDYVIVGYPATTKAMYEAVDLYGFVNDSMLPTVDTSALGIDDSMQAIIDGFQDGFGDDEESFSNEVALNNHTEALISIVENAIKNTAKVFYNSAYYTFELKRDSYTVPSSEDTTGIWTGKFILTSISEREENGDKIKRESGIVEITVSGNEALFLEQKIYRLMSNKDEVALYDITNIKMEENTFKTQLGYYSLRELINLLNSFKACSELLYSTEITVDILSKNILEKYQNFYKIRESYIEDEIKKRQEMVNAIKLFYYFNPLTGECSGDLYEHRYKTNTTLDFESFIKNKPNGIKLWNTFCSYRMEDKYSNPNYISDGLTDAEVVEKAQKLLEDARKELYKASHPQYTLSATMNNLLALEAFQPLKNCFSVGNWVRVKIDDNIFRLRLLSYQVNFDEIQSIDVEFSTVESIWSGESDIKSIMDSAANITKSYSGVKHQMDKSKGTTTYVQNWLTEGFNATLTKFVNDNDQDIVIDGHGILCRKFDDIFGNYSPYQLRVVKNGLYTTHDNWLTIDTGIGRISYIDPETGERVDDYGVIAKTIIGKLFIGEKLKIYGANNSVILDENGITLDGGTIKFTSKLSKDSVEGIDDFEKNIEALIGDVDAIKNQVDGKIDTWFFDYEPSDDKEPTKTWIQNNEEESHKGDLFYCTSQDNQHSYRYIYNQNTGKYEWMLIVDSDITSALELASKAKDIADNKRRIFVVQPSPPYDEGDLWVQGKDGDILHCIIPKLDMEIFSQSDWEKSSKYTDDTKAQEALVKAQAAIDDAVKAVTTSKNYTNNQCNNLSNNLTNAYKSYTDSEVSALDKAVSGYLGIDGGTLIGGSYIISPYIGGGYLDITNDDGEKRVIIDPKGLSNTDYIFQVHNGKEISVGIKADGNVEIRGTIYAKNGEFSGQLKSPTGQIGGFYINENSLFCNNPTSETIKMSSSNYTKVINGKRIDNLRMSFGNNFGVTEEGKLYCGNAEISGKANITGGYIGGWTINSSSIFYGFLHDNKPGYIGLSTSDFTRVINGEQLSGLRFAIADNFAVTKDGKLYVSGGSIGGFNINSSYLSINTSSLGGNNNSIYIGENGISCGTGFVVTKNGFCKIKGNISSHGSFTLVGGLWDYSKPWEPVFTEDGNAITMYPRQISYTSTSLPPGRAAVNLYVDNGIETPAIFIGTRSKPFTLLTENGMFREDANTNTGLSCFLNFKSDILGTHGNVGVDGFFDDVTISGSMNPKNTSSTIGLSSRPWNYLYVNKIRLVDASLNCEWADDSIHNILSVENKLDMYLGWNGVANGKTYDSKLILRGNSIRLKNTSGTVVTSDERLKNSFMGMDRYEGFFNDLEPCFFKYNNGASGRYHSGFKAQQVLESLKKNGLTSNDFAGFVKYEVSEDSSEYNGLDEEYGLIYSEFTALNTYMVQKLWKENKELKKRIERLEGILEEQGAF